MDTLIKIITKIILSFIDSRLNFTLNLLTLYCLIIVITLNNKVKVL